MKKMLIASTQKGRLFLCTCLTALLAVAAQAQDIMVVHPHEAAPQQFEVANIDSMTWENATTLHIYLRNQAAQDFAIANVDSLTWLVISTPEPPITVGQVELGEGEGAMTLTGIADRVDGWLHEGKLYLRVVDYKTGRKTFSLSDVW